MRRGLTVPLLALLQYIVVDTLGRGSFGKVKLCLNTGDDTLYAVKVVNTRAVSLAAVRGCRRLQRPEGASGHAGSGGCRQGQTTSACK